MHNLDEVSVSGQSFDLKHHISPHHRSLSLYLCKWTYLILIKVTANFK
jgi:hypothetical protein